MYSICRIAAGLLFASALTAGCARSGPAPAAATGSAGESTLVDTLFSLAENDDVEGVKALLAIDTVAALDRVFARSRSRAAQVNWSTLLAVLRRLHRPTCSRGTQQGPDSYLLSCTNLDGEFQFEAVLQDEVWRLRLPDPELLLAQP